MEQFDYSSPRLYFITICAAEHKHLFGSIISTTENGFMQLNTCGELLKNHIERLKGRYQNVAVTNYVIMPNHVHMILDIDNNNRIPVTQIIGLFKLGFSKEIGFSAWQRSFYDHIIRNEAEYKRINDYIDNNPAKWTIDKYYC